MAKVVIDQKFSFYQRNFIILIEVFSKSILIPNSLLILAFNLQLSAICIISFISNNLNLYYCNRILFWGILKTMFRM